MPGPGHVFAVPRTAAALRIGVAVLMVLGATGCGGGPVGALPTAAPSATAPACRTALGRLPASVLGRGRSPWDVAGAATWGEPPVVLRCGLPEPPPSTQPCLAVDGVDWLVDQTGDPLVFTSYGRSPAVEVRVPSSYGRSDAPSALVDLAAVAQALPATGRHCIGN